MQVVGIDTETHLFKPGTKAPPVVVMSLDRGDGYGSLHLREGAEGIFRQLVADDEVMLVAHNASYDMTVLANQYNDLELLSAIFDAYERGRIRCSKIRSMLIAIAFDWMDYDPKLKAPPKFSLAKMVERHLGEEIEGKHGPDIWRMRYAELDGVPLEQWPQEAKDYARLDAVYHRRLFEMLERTYGKPADIDEVLQCKTDFVFYLMSCWGMLTDPEEVEALAQALEKEVAEAEKKLVALGLMREPKGTVRKDLFCDRVALLYEKRNLPLPMTPGGKVSLTAKVLKVVADDPIVAAYIESKGKPSADLEAYGLVEWASATKNTALIQQRVKDWYEAHDLPVPMTEPDNENTKPSIRTNEETLSDTDDEGLNLLADSSAARKELTSFVPVIRTREPIHAGWNILVKSGRSSCRGPNLQQLPRREGVRECFVARPGYVYVAADYHVAELCSFAQVCLNIPEIGYSRLGDAINAGKDPHLMFVGNLMGRPYEEVVVRYEDGDEEVKGLRPIGKMNNFGRLGGLGDASFCAYVKANSPNPKKPLIISLEKAAEYKEVWFNTWPEAREYFRWHNNLLMMGGGTIAVTQMGSGRVRGGVGYCDGLNTRFQGLTADGAKESLFRISRECYTKTDSPLFGSRPVAFIHDEILMESPEEMAADAAERLSQLMVEGMSVYVPDVKVSADAHIMRRWYKGAKPVRDANGRLIPWEPKEKAA